MTAVRARALMVAFYTAPKPLPGAPRMVKLLEFMVNYIINFEYTKFKSRTTTKVMDEELGVTTGMVDQINAKTKEHISDASCWISL